MSTSELHSSIIALVSLASGIASKHPDMCLCQLDKLRHIGINDAQINTVIEIARHIRDEASQKLDYTFDQKAGMSSKNESTNEEASGNSCCSTTNNGQSCC